MKKKTKTLLLTALMGATIGFSALATSCSGNLALESFIVDTSKVTTIYEVGDAVDFTDIILTAKYNDGDTESVALNSVKIYLDDEDVTNNLSKITETKGEKMLRFVYTTEYGEKEHKISITVNEKNPETPENPDDPPAQQKTKITTLNTPDFVAKYKAQIQSATNDKTEVGFEGKFFKNEGTEYYVVGDDNAFKFLPVASSFDLEEMEVVTLENFVADSTVLIWKDDDFVALTKQTKEGAQFVYEYKDGDTVLVTEDASKNQFDFADGAIGGVFRLSVKPSATVYEVDESVNSVVFDVQIVDGYNVYDAKDLAVIDNSGRDEWAALKATYGLTNVTTNGVILHQNTVMSAENIPEAFYYTLADDYEVYYKDETGASKKPEELGLTRTYFYDQYDFSDGRGFVEIYKRNLSAGQAFAFYGNYFEFDASKLPLVSSFAPDKDKNGNTLSADDTWYGGDFSNVTLLKFTGKVNTTGNEDEALTFNNIAIRGNAENQQITLDTAKTKGAKGETLVRAGGVIFAKTGQAKASFENSRTYNFFISFFGDPGATVNYNRTKVYDSFQDAVFAWSNTTINITNSYFKRAGGPMIIMWHGYPDEANPETRIPQVFIDANSEVDTTLTGAETWFKSVSADAIVSTMREGINQILQAVCSQMPSALGGKTKLITTQDAKGNQVMNIVALLMRNATNASEALNAIDTQGKFVYGDPTKAMLNRMKTESFGQALHQILPTGTVALNLGDKLFYVVMEGGAPYIVDAFNTMADSPAKRQQDALSFYQTLQTVDYIGFNQGGISVMFQLFTVEATA